jgi:hypothetical protein
MEFPFVQIQLALALESSSSPSVGEKDVDDGDGDANESCGDERRATTMILILPTLREHKNEVFLLTDKDDVLPSVYA